MAPLSEVFPVTVPALLSAKGRERIAMMTAYDAPTAALLDAAGLDVLLVGDSVEMTVLCLHDSLYDSRVARFQTSSAYCLKHFTTGTSRNGTMLKPFAPASLIEAPRK